MTAFLKIDTCRSCQKCIPWEWAPAVLLNGKAMAGTGVWRSQLLEGCCPRCQAAFEEKRRSEERQRQRRARLVELLGGEKPYREFTFENYCVEPGNRLAYDRAKAFNPIAESHYFWGRCGVGKTHLALAAARRCFEETLAVTVLPAYQLSRKVRMKEPQQEQAVIDDLAKVDVLILDDVGEGLESAFTERILREILNARDSADRGGLFVTSQYSLDQLAVKLSTDAISSRLSGLCRITEVSGVDRRLRKACP